MSVQIVGRELIRSGFVRVLRTAFESNSDFRFKYSSTDPNQPAEDSKIFIYDAWPWKKVGYPAVIVSLGAGDPLMRTIGGEHRFDNSTDFASTLDGLTYAQLDSEEFGGGLETNVILNAYARSAIERSQLMDALVLYFRHYFISAFEKEGVSVVSMRQGGEGQQLLGSDPVYSDTLEVTVYSEFERTIATQLAGTINAMSLTHLFDVLPGGASHES